MRQHFEELDLSQRRDGKTILLIVHQDFLEREDLARYPVLRLVHFTKCALAELLHHFIFANL